MSRTLPTGLNTAISAAEQAPIFLVQLNWSTGTIRACNAFADITWGGYTWTGLGDIASISEIKESADLAANGTMLTLSGLSTAELAEALDNASLGQPAKIYYGVLAVDGFVIDPYVVFDGVIDAPNISTDEEGKSTITLPLEKELYDNRGEAARYTDQYQQFKFPGDLGCQYVASLANQQFTWGKATVNAAGQSGGSGAGTGNDDINLPTGYQT